MWSLSSRRELNENVSRPARPAQTYATVESMEPRQLLAAAPALVLQNLDVVPGNERMVFNRIGHLDAKVPNVVHDRAVLRLWQVEDFPDPLHVAAMNAVGDQVIKTQRAGCDRGGLDGQGGIDAGAAECSRRRSVRTSRCYLGGDRRGSLQCHRPSSSDS